MIAVDTQEQFGTGKNIPVIVEFLCDYYSYDGNFQNNYYLGEPMTVEEDMVISNVEIPGGTMEATYRLTDIYNQAYWTPVMGRQAQP